MDRNSSSASPFSTSAGGFGEQDIEQIDEDIQMQNLRFEEVKKFYEAFAFNTVIFDPLDRDIMYADEDEDSDNEENLINQATKRDDLLVLIHKLQPILGLSLRLPLPNERHIKLKEMFEMRKKICREIIQEYINQAKNLGNEFKGDPRLDETIQQHLADLNFFAAHELLPDSAKQAEIFKQELQAACELCEKEKLYRENSNLGQFVID